jgi:hypothetical protein
MREQELLQQDEHRHRSEVALGVVRELGVEMRIDREGGVGGHQHRVAVGCGARDRVGGDDGVGAGLVLDHHRLSPLTRQLLRDLAREHVDAAAGRIGDDDAHRLRGPRLRLDARGETEEEESDRALQSHGAQMIS